MQTALYRTRNDEGEEGHWLVVYDETQECLLCGLPVGGASMGGTAICGWCDCGRTRQGAKPQNRTPGIKLDVWYNVHENFHFQSREQAEAKMYEMHEAGIPGWRHVIQRYAKTRVHVS